MGNYEDYIQAGLTGGYEPSDNSPRMIFLEDNVDSPPMDYLDVSLCGSYIGVVSSREEITIHKAYPNFTITPDKSIKSRAIKVNLKKSSSRILSCHFYRDRINNINYVYIVASDMIYLIDTEKKSSKSKELTMTEVEVIPNCVYWDQDSGNLLVSQSYHNDPNVPPIGEAIYNLETPPTLKFCSEGNRVFTKLYGKLMVVVTEKEKQNKKHYLEIYDAGIQILFYSNSYHEIHDILIDNNVIYLFVTHSDKNGVTEKELIKLTEITVGEKIKILLEKNLFEEASQVAINAECSEEIKSTVAREQGDHYYINRKFKDAMAQYVKTIGYEAPSYVIEKFLEVENLDLLIEYLEKLIDTPITKNNNLLGNNKDYTALLLNWYLKQQRKDKIEEQMIKDRGSDSIFDVETAIDVCRQKAGYSDLAINLAKRYEKWELLVSIYIEDSDSNISGALEVIDEKIRDVKSKLDLLKQYGGVLLSINNSNLYKEKKTLNLLLKITKYLILKAKNPLFSSPEYQNYTLNSTRQIKMSEIIKIFVDNNDLLCDYLKNVIEAHGDDANKICGEDLHICHKLLECYLNKYSDKKASQLSWKVSKIEAEIKNFVKIYESKIDKNYVLYLFRFYSYLDGIQKLSQQLNMNQELLSVYIEKKEYNNIIRLCKEKGGQEKDLWIQALNHFREEGENSKLQECLEFIGEKKVLTPLMVLDILQNTDSDLKFKYIKNYMLSEIKKLDTKIKDSKDEIDDNMDRIEKKNKEYKILTTSPQLFEQSRCSKCKDRLTVPTYHFMCGHVYHEGCVEEEKETYKRICLLDHQEFSETLSKKKLYEKAKDHQQFFTELESDDKKMDTIAHYYGVGLFNDIQKELEESNL